MRLFLLPMYALRTKADTVGDPAPTVAAVRASAPTIWASVTGVPNLTIPEDRFTSFTSYQAALRAYEAEPRVRVLWEVGGKPGTVPGSPIASAESTAPDWPIPTAKARTLYLGADGSLADRAPRRAQAEPNCPVPDRDRRSRMARAMARRPRRVHTKNATPCGAGGFGCGRYRT